MDKRRFLKLNRQNRTLEKPESSSISIWTVFGPFSVWLQIQASGYYDVEGHKLKAFFSLATFLLQPRTSYGRIVIRLLCNCCVRINYELYEHSMNQQPATTAHSTQ